MHKRRFNEMTLRLLIRPRGPLLIKSGQEAGADPTLLDMNFVRAHHPTAGGQTVYLPGSSLKGVMRAYAEKIGRTVADGVVHETPLACNPLGKSKDDPRAVDFYCGKLLEKGDGDERSPAAKHRLSCPICRTFGNTALAGHLRLADAYPSAATRREANATEQRDGVAIDRVTGAVAVGPFNLEVVTRGEFEATLTLSNFQLWQVGLLAVVLRDIGAGRVPLGFGKTRGLGVVELTTAEVEVAYPGRFGAQSNGHNLGASLYGVSAFLGDEEAGAYGYRPEEPLPLPTGGQVSDDGAFGRYGLCWQGDDAARLTAACVPAWAAFVAAWRGEATP